MIGQLKSEFKKLFSIRSTYVISIVVLLFVAGLVGFYGQGYKVDKHSLDSLFLAGTITTFSNLTAIAGSIIALLLLAHEYRYNTIIYTLTSSNSRSKVLVAKIVAVLVFVFCLSLVVIGAALVLTIAGVAASGHSLPHQDINYVAYMAKAIFMCEGFALFGLLLAALVRNLVGAIVILLIVPNTVEGLLSLILKDKTVYLPFSALQQVVEPPVLVGGQAAHPATSANGVLSAPKGALVFLAYLIVGWAITWYIFLRRDAQ